MVNKTFFWEARGSLLKIKQKIYVKHQLTGCSASVPARCTWTSGIDETPPAQEEPSRFPSPFHLRSGSLGRRAPCPTCAHTDRQRDHITAESSWHCETIPVLLSASCSVHLVSPGTLDILKTHCFNEQHLRSWLHTLCPCSVSVICSCVKDVIKQNESTVPTEQQLTEPQASPSTPLSAEAAFRGPPSKRGVSGPVV